MKKTHKGFTLLELFIVMAVVIILAGAIMFASEESVVSARVSNIVSNMRVLKTAALEWIADHGDFIDPRTYEITYPFTYLDIHDRRNIGVSYGIPSVIHNMILDDTTHEAWRETFTKYIEKNVFDRISFHSSKAGQGQAFAEEGGYAVVDRTLAAIQDSSVGRAQWFVVYRLMPDKDDVRHTNLKIRERLASRAKELGLYKLRQNTRDYYTSDADYVYMEIIDFRKGKIN